MKKFEFRLEQAMEWRQAQARVEESKLEGLHARLRALGAEAEALLLEKESAGRTLIAAPDTTGLELAFLDAFRKAADGELARLERQQAEVRRAIQKQILAVTERRREVRLLERLKAQRLAAWRHEAEREIEQQAAESYLALWNGPGKLLAS